MIDRTLARYSILSYLSMEKGMTQIDLYIPLACRCIQRRGIPVLKGNELSQWFNEDYGMGNVYKGVFHTLMKKLSSNGCLRWEKAEYLVNEKEIAKKCEGSNDNSIDQDLESLCRKIREYSIRDYQSDYSTDDIQQGLKEFLHRHDGDMLFSEDKTMDTLSKQKNGKTVKTKLKYIIAQFILWSRNNAVPYYKMVKKLSKGSALSAIVSMRDVNSYTGKMSDVVIALDAPILFNLLGLNEDSNRLLEEELLGILKGQGAQFVMFDQHYQEVNNSISATIYYLKTKNYDISKASRLLMYCLRRHVSSSQLTLIQQQLEAIMNKWGISVQQAPSAPSAFTEIDNNKLEESIKKIYKESGNSIDDIRQKSIDNDVDVISYIYRLRGNNVATNFKNCKALLITNNTAIAYASKDRELSNVHHMLPVCLTDVLLSTLLWFTYPKASENINEQALMSECYQYITLQDDILKRFYDDVVKINAQTPITEEEMLNVKTSEMIPELLESKTYNDVTLYTDTTTAEILEEFDNIRNRKANENEAIIETHTKNFYRLSYNLARAIEFICWAALVALFIWLKFVNFSDWHSVLRIIMNTLISVTAVWGLLCWIGFIPSKVNTTKLLTMKINNQLTKFFNKE